MAARKGPSGTAAAASPPLLTLSILLLSPALISVSVATTYVEVKTSLGPVRGNRLPGGALEFLGMPFGDQERYEPSRLRTRPYSTKPFDATYFGPACLQTLSANETYGVEDCLVMNVWAPDHATMGDDLPVLVYIYGGSNDFGEAEPYNASQMAVNQRAVVASFNYRTGPLGFVPFEEQLSQNISSGNLALIDMQVALRWVRREIRKFGGDPSQVGIFGQSSGAGCVELHTVIPSSNGLFRSAISQSGGLSAMPLKEALNTTRELARRLNCTTRGYKSVLECLKKTDGDQIIFAQGTQCITPNYCVGLSFSPVVDGILIPEDPEQLLIKGKVNNVNILYGLNTNDSYLFTMEQYMDGLNKTAYVDLVQSMFGNPESARTALEMYPPLENGEDNTPVLGWLQSEQELCAKKSTLLKYFSAGKGAVYFYRYNYWYQSTNTCTAVANYHPARLGSMHQDEVSFVFGQPIFMNLGYTNCSVPGWSGYDPTCTGCHFNEKEAAFAKTMGGFWTNMASSGNPNKRATRADTGDKYVKEFWPQFSPRLQQNIILKPVKSPYTPETMGTEEFVGRKEACEFWDHAY